jgi:hypothetical protein
VAIGAGVASTAASAWGAARMPSGGDDVPSIEEKFLGHIDQLPGWDADRRRALADAFRGDVAAGGVESALGNALAAIYPDYRGALSSSDEEAGSFELLRPFAASDDPFLAADASYYLARALINAQRYEEVPALLARLEGDLAGFTVHGPTALYFSGVAHAGLLNNTAAVEALSRFLEQAPNAPERLRVAAWRQLQEIQMVEEGQLSDVYQRMDYSRRRLDLDNTDSATQDQQKKIVDILAKIIREQEKKECGSGTCKQQNKSAEQQQQQQRQAQNQNGKGGSSRNPHGVARRTYDDGPASPWSRLRDRSREAANAAVKDQLPARYRDVVQRYYESSSSGKAADARSSEPNK